MRRFGAYLCIGVFAWSVHSGVSATLDPARTPGANFDLTHWKCTLPDVLATEIPAAQLEAGYTSEFFFTGPDGAMTFWCPVTGGTTANTTFPRSELREMLNPRDSSVNWPGHGTHILRAQCKVLKSPSAKKIIIGQVHGYGVAPLVKVQWNDGAVQAYFKDSPAGSDTKYTLATVPLGGRIDYEIRVVNGVASVTVNGASRSYDFFAPGPGWTTNEFYFKAGAYVQDNLGLPDEGGSVAFYEISTSHPPAAPAPAKPTITTQPQSQTVPSGGAATLSTAAIGTPAPTYQWRKNGSTVSGATNATLIVSNFRSTQPVDYDVLVKNSQGSVTSSVARLYLNSPVRFVSNKRDAMGRMVSTLVGPANLSYVIEASTNLTTWAPAATNSSSAGIVNFTNANAAGTPRRFFRVRAG